MSRKGSLPLEEYATWPRLSAEDSRASIRSSGFSLGWLISAAAHLLVLAALLWLHARPLPQTDPAPVLVDLVDLPDSPPPGPPAMQASAGAPENTVEPVTIPPVALQPVTIQPVPQYPIEITPAVTAPDTSDLLSESQLAAAVGAEGEGSGAGGGGNGAGACNMALILQRALQRDPMVHTAVADADRVGQAVMLWNGDWIRSGNQDGKGLSGVRQAILWELAFAPEACRSKRVHGLVLLALADGTRFGIGADDWRWSDLLGLRATPAEH